MNTLTVFLLGCVGGVLPDALRIIRNRYEMAIPAYLKTLNFWLGLGLLVLVGGLTAVIVQAQTPKDALIYGYASPAILSQLAAGLTPRRAERGVARMPEAGEAHFRLLRWWGS
jgi:hypothetical protein